MHGHTLLNDLLSSQTFCVERSAFVLSGTWTLSDAVKTHYFSLAFSVY